MKKIIIAALLGCGFVASAGPARAAEGQLGKDQIRQVVLAHISEVRACYNQALERDATAHGSLVIDFVIGAQGEVTSSKVAKSDMADAAAPECIRGVIAGWLFPKPDGGEVSVSYPFVLEPG